MKQIQRNTILAFTFLILSLLSAQAEDVTVVARIDSLRGTSPSSMIVKLENEGLSSLLSTLDPADEVLLKGRLEYHPVTVEGRTEMNPTFHVEKMVPVSLRKLNEMQFVPVDQKIVLKLPERKNQAGLPVTGKVANAMTMTATLLMLKDLSGNQATQPKTDTMNTGLIFSAGVLATGLFLWEQFHAPSQKRDL